VLSLSQEEAAKLGVGKACCIIYAGMREIINRLLCTVKSDRDCRLQLRVKPIVRWRPHHRQQSGSRERSKTTEDLELLEDFQGLTWVNGEDA